MKKANTAEINPKLAYAATFDENLFKEAGFEIVEVGVSCDYTVDNTPEEQARIGKYVFTPTLQERRRLNLPPIKEEVNKTLAGITKMFKGATVTIKSVTAEKNGKEVVFRVTGGKDRRIRVYSIDGAPSEMYDAEFIEALLDELYYVACHYTPSRTEPPRFCDSREKLEEQLNEVTEEESV